MGSCQYCGGTMVCSHCGEPEYDKRNVIQYVRREWKAGRKAYGTRLAMRYNQPVSTMYLELHRLVEDGELVKLSGRGGFAPPEAAMSEMKAA